jgi:hypothetical protein
MARDIALFAIDPKRWHLPHKASVGAARMKSMKAISFTAPGLGKMVANCRRTIFAATSYVTLNE